jgi:hypothetical protein
VAANINIGDRLFDCRHVTGYAAAAGTAGRMMGVLLDGGGARPGLRIRAMATKAKCVAGLTHHSHIVITVRIVAAEARHAAGIHQALNEIVALHPILVRRAVGEMGERGFAELVLLQLPEFIQVLPNLEAYGPIVVFSGDRIRQRLSLGMTLDAGVAGAHIIETGRVENVARGWSRNVFAARSVTPLAADVPLGDRLGRNIVIHRMTPVAEGASRPLGVVGRIVGYPPIRAIWHEIRPPNLVGNVPLRW